MTIKAKKYFGQNFLINEALSEKIAHSLDVTKNEKILEIGPGKGALTKFLVEKYENIKVVEIDLDCVAFLEKKFQHIDVIHDDFLKISNEKIQFKKYAIIGNFPYNVSSQILFKILEKRDQITQVVGMFQKEVADRICSNPNSKKYGILSVLIQAYFNCEQLFDVGPENFKPKPKINSSVIRLTRNSIKKLNCNHKQFLQIVKLGFSQRRKKLKNALKKITNFENLNLEPTINQRAEELNVSDFIELTNKIFPNH